MLDIRYVEQENMFVLSNGRITYAFCIAKGRYLEHCYFGPALAAYRGSCRQHRYDRAFCATPDAEDKTFSLATILREYPDAHQGDFRQPAYMLSDDSGDAVTHFRYHGYRVADGTPELEGLPSVYAEADDEAKTLEIDLVDDELEATITLRYTIMRDYPVILRSSMVRNDGLRAIRVERLLSMSLDLIDDGWDLLTLGGSHVNEKQMSRRSVSADTVLLESRCGTSSPQATPFIGLLRPETTELQGEAIGINLIYSGNFAGYVQRGRYGTLRAQLGINPEGFSWMLEPGTSLDAPQAVMVYSTRGLDGMSQAFHGLYANRICRGHWRDRERPIVLNSWEAMYLDIDEEKAVRLAGQAADLGAEVLVIDDGWFAGRNTLETSLGDWTADPRKFPNGLGPVADACRSHGIGLGIWVEPEMISENSLLFRAHPDWVLRSKRHEPIRSRDQLVLDLTRPDVCSFVIEAVSSVIRESQAVYVKWDMNRHITDPVSLWGPCGCQGEVFHRYVLGLYRILDELNARFPRVLFEGCSSGGGRFDAGMLAYMPQTWASDNSDAICRLSIQRGTSVLFPPVTMGCHVSASPNHQVGRNTPIETRYHVASAGNLGYELDPTALSEQDRTAVRSQIERYKRCRRVLQFGSYHRLPVFGPEGFEAWETVSPDRSRAVVTVVQILSQAAYRVPVIRLTGLDSASRYRCNQSGDVYDGDELMYAGVTVPRVRADFHSWQFWFERVEEEIA